MNKVSIRILGIAFVGMAMAVVAILAFSKAWLFGDSQTKFAGNPAACQIYIMHEIDPDDSQLVAIDPQTQAVTVIGPVYKQVEFEGLELHPVTHILYTNTSKGGDFYKIDAKTGGLSLVGILNFTKVNSFTFRPTDHSLWAWAEERGIITIDPETAIGTLVHASLRDAKALAWNNEGTLLYAAIDTGELYAYDFAKKTFDLLSDNLPKETEGFSMLSDGMLLGSTKDEENNLVIFTYDLSVLKIAKSLALQTPYADTEGIAWLASCGNPLP